MINWRRRKTTLLEEFWGFSKKIMRKLNSMRFKIEITENGKINNLLTTFKLVQKWREGDLLIILVVVVVVVVFFSIH